MAVKAGTGIRSIREQPAALPQDSGFGPRREFGQAGGDDHPDVPRFRTLAADDHPTLHRPFGVQDCAQ
jgi:hypothetical protein